MNSKTRKLVKLTVLVLTFCLVSLPQSTSAKSSRGLLAGRGSVPHTQSVNSNCKTITGNSAQFFDPATSTLFGTNTNAGVLNGTLEDVVNVDAGFVLTPDPNVITYLSNLTIKTVNGELKASSDVNTFNFVTGNFTEFGQIDPTTSTGKFAGATGVIFFTGRTVGSADVGPYEAEISAHICFAQ
jgi:hypothetical protein